MLLDPFFPPKCIKFQNRYIYIFSHGVVILLLGKEKKNKEKTVEKSKGFLLVYPKRRSRIPIKLAFFKIKNSNIF